MKPSTIAVAVASSEENKVLRKASINSLPVTALTQSAAVGTQSSFING